MVLHLLRGSASQTDENVGALRPEAPRKPSAYLAEVEHAGVGMFWATNTRGELAFLSQSALASLGDGAEAILGKPLTSIFTQTSVDDDSESSRSLKLKMQSRSRIEDQVVEVVPNAASAADQASVRWWTILELAIPHSATSNGRRSIRSRSTRAPCAAAHNRVTPTPLSSPRS